MIRAVLLIAVAVAAASLLGLAIAQGSGYVLIAYGGFRFESSLWLSLLCLLLLWLGLYLLRLLLRALGVSGRLLNPWSRRHRSRRQRRAAERGVLELSEGRWQAARQHLAQAARDESQPLLYYFGAARAANRLGDSEGRDRLLEQALQREPRAELGIALEHAELQLQAGEAERARQTLEVMHERHPQHPEVLRRLVEVLLAQDAGAELGRLLPEVRRQRLFDEARLAELDAQAWQARLRQLTAEGDLQALQKAWEPLSSAQRHALPMLAPYVRALLAKGADAQAEELLRGYLRKRYEPALVELYGRLGGGDAARQLSEAEGWLRAHPEDAILLRCLARLSLRNRLWGKARDYYEASLRFARDPATCAELSRLLDELGESERSRQLLRESLGLLGGFTPALPAVR